MSSYRLKAHRLDENEVSLIRLRKTIGMVFEKSRVRPEKKFPVNLLKKRNKTQEREKISFKLL